VAFLSSGDELQYGLSVMPNAPPTRLCFPEAIFFEKIYWIFLFRLFRVSLSLVSTYVLFL
jgi:hypothetical protein